jgi:hypothetical protein
MYVQYAFSRRGRPRAERTTIRKNNNVYYRVGSDRRDDDEPLARIQYAVHTTKHGRRIIIVLLSKRSSPTN